ncbi:YTX2-like protein [Mya arenaria]|uniref:YTX2-like protein n=1 Tax=Mya arenaria TaxID=6604 RepID=A0ABY7D728_MYAAR|nr:YTX2-like protein [Mya arenaria]
MSVTFCTLNTKRLGNKQKRLQVFKYIKVKSYDVIFLQETHSDASTSQSWKREWDGCSFFSGLKSNKKASHSLPIIYSRLDYFIISEYLRNTIPKCDIKPGYKTDHSTVLLTPNTLEQKRGPGYFKINNNIINHTEYQNQIKTAIMETVQINSNYNPNTLWELIKGTIRNIYIKYFTYI